MYSSGETCWSVVASAARGDSRARSGFCRTYEPLVRAILAARWRGTSLLGEVDDAVQDTFVECFRENGSLQRVDAERGDFRGYLFGVVRNIARRVERVAQRERKGDAIPDSALTAIATQDDHFSVLFDREWARTLMREAADLMRARAKARGPGARLRVELLRLRFAEDRPIREIAAEWDMDPDAVHRAHAKAREEFHSCLRQIVSFHAVRTESDLDAECLRLLGLLA